MNLKELIQRIFAPETIPYDPILKQKIEDEPEITPMDVAIEVGSRLRNKRIKEIERELSDLEGMISIDEETGL